MKREILLLISAAALALAGRATHDYGKGGTTTDTGTVYGSDDSSTSDFGGRDIWRKTPNAQRERGFYARAGGAGVGRPSARRLSTLGSQPLNDVRRYRGMVRRLTFSISFAYFAGGCRLRA